jgi:hypothetical protein
MKHVNIYQTRRRNLLEDNTHQIRIMVYVIIFVLCMYSLISSVLKNVT